MKNTSILFLKLAIILIGMAILALCLILVPKFGSFVGELYPDKAYMKDFVFIVMDGAAVPFYFALYQAFNLLRYIDKKAAFSELSVQALKNIKYCAMAISGLYGIGLPLLYFIGKKVDPPFGFIGLIIIFASLVIAVFAVMLQRLLQEAINIKSENDLTI
ncbi:DUF2975 domain-containing protein [Neobacillus thermocopriae]|uniref:DUF2975 domain-containing protein n=1 Tax=Neobacillus thermocopriae TaxID=1215031 RepID=UPI00376FA8CA